MQSTPVLSRLLIRNPINGADLYELPEATEAVITDAFTRARSVQPSIEAMSVRDRITEMMKVNDYIIANREKIITRIIEETGKARFDAFATEVFEVLDVIDHFKKVTPSILKDRHVSTPVVLLGKRSKQYIEPLGTILVIAPWNYPFYQGIVPSLLAFLAGNAVIFKPSELTPLHGLLEEVLDKSGFMKDAIQVVYGGKETGKKLIEARPDKIHFTGSVASGKKVMEQAARHLIPVDLELGGKDPSIVFEDVDLERAVNGVMWGALTNCGQSCTSIERVYVQEKIYDRFVSMLVERVNKLRASSPSRKYTAPEDCDVGCMTAEFQVVIMEAHIREAVERGATLHTGGKREPGSLHFPPTVITGVDHTMKVVMEETFGPVIPVMKFKTEDEAVRLANDSPYGLSASVWSKDVARAERVARRIRTGNVSINSHMLTEANPGLPFGGVKDSGFGRYKGEWGLLTFCNMKSILIDKMGPVIEPHWYPYTKEKYDMMGDIITNLFSRSKSFMKFVFTGLKLEKIGTRQKL